MDASNSTIRYVLADLSHLQLLIDSRIEFLVGFWGAPGKQTEETLRDELKRFFEKELPERTYVCWLALDNERLVGVGGMKIFQKPGSFRSVNGWCGYIMNMYTIPSYRKQGIATQLLECLLDSGKELGISYFELHATDAGEPIYVKNGFAKHSEPTYRKFI